MGQTKLIVDFKTRLRTVVRAMFKGEICNQPRCYVIVRVAHNALCELQTAEKPMSEADIAAFAAEMFAEWSYSPR